MSARFEEVYERSEADTPWIAAVIVYLCAVGAFYWPWISGAVTIPWDAKAHWLPQLQFLAGSLARGDSPFWNPYVFSGHPQVADPQSLIFSPQFLFLALFNPSPSPWAADMVSILMIAAGGLAVLVWFRDRGWHCGGGLIAAMAFSFGPVAWRLQHTGQLSSLVYLAITLVLIDRALRRSSWTDGLAAGVSAAFMVLGRDQIGLIGVYLLIGFVVWHWIEGDGEQRLKRSILPLLAGGIAGGLLIALPLAMTVLVAEASNRPQITFEGAGAGSLHPALLLTWLLPDLYGASGAMRDFWGPPSFTWEGTGLFIAQNVGVLYAGAVPFLLLAWCFVSGKAFYREIRFFSVALIVTLLFALGWYSPAFAAFYYAVPGVDFFRRPADGVAVIGLLAALLSGYSGHRLFSANHAGMPRGPWVLVMAIAAAMFAAAAMLAWHFDRLGMAYGPIGASGLTTASAFLVIVLARWLHPIRPIIATGILPVFMFVDVITSNGPNTSNALPPKTYDVLRGDTDNATIRELKRRVAEGLSGTRRDRVELIGLGFHWPNASETHELENTLGYNPLRLRIYEEATGAGDSSGSPDSRKLGGLMASYRSKMSDLLGLRFIAAGTEIANIDPNLKAGDVLLVAKHDNAFIYENPRALPRVLYASEAYFDDFDTWPKLAENRADLGFHLSGIEFQRTVLLHEPGATRSWPLHPPGLPGPDRSVRIVSYANTEVVIEADGPGGYVVLNDVWHPWWVASVDGQGAAVERANFLFRAVGVPPGRHTVRFSFAPIAGAISELRARLTSGIRERER
ncbi:MAG: glycosyltransferase family 39 protein [Alphaproteobacteria bacterium]|nr:glycosyltransferase family 39 protein [Alphaproteobacteria bacterium]